ncbi:hypothetical protein HG536_0H01150 [Torulaspora globosa]|uniref:Uncharacterized protein n=1 Tax=Torulaspora globosa TaxID=48254 RepID=A0A7G3ZMK4_9SACH|nr:uncharacterized protein HG536_0H01150 [Torulaspora globosa]QLL34740.1 hypothetical protein HG536_0H01150 [Torulaspora globosa]
MPDEISLSLEETNKIRASLGLKAIAPANDQDNGSYEGIDKILPKRASSTVERSEGPRFIENDKIHMLRRKLAALKDASGLSRSAGNDESSSQGDWLSRIGSKPVKISFDEDGDEEGDELPLVRVSHKVEDIADPKGVILTLKENSVLADGDDTLEAENLVQEREEAKRIHMSQMNKNRRRMRRKIQVSSAEIELQEEAENEDNILAIGVAKNYNSTSDEPEPKHSGKLKVSFSGTDSDASDGGDFKPVQIKKRKKNGTGARTKAKSITLPPRIQPVELKNHDLDFEDLEQDLFVPFNSVKRSKLLSEVATPEELAAQIAKEKREREQKIAQVAEASDNLIIDEGTRFLESLRTAILEKPAHPDSADVQEDVGLQESAPTTVETSKKWRDDREAPDFYEGLASTLNFIRERNVLPKLQSLTSDSSKPAIPNYQKEARKIRERNNSQMRQDKTQYTAKELEEIENYQDEQIARRISELQAKTLQDYDPEVKLQYKDESGNQLTTKEAYKKLSQKFHGTRSNQRKQAKAQSRIEARKTQQQKSSVFDVL